MKNIKKSKIIIIILLFISGIFLTTAGIILNLEVEKNKPIENDKEESNKENEDNQEKDDLLGLDRLESQKKVTSTIEGYIKQIPNLEEYLKEHDKTSLTIKEMKEDLHIDTTEIEKSEYGCNIEETIVDFKDGIDKYKILISCDIFLLK